MEKYGKFLKINISFPNAHRNLIQLLCLHFLYNHIYIYAPDETFSQHLPLFACNSRQWITQCTMEDQLKTAEN